jgi:hypothetical protein
LGSEDLGDSVQGVQDAIGNAIKDGESVRIPAVTYSRYYPATETWVIELNKYHRDNLIWLFNAIGYPGGNDAPVKRTGVECKEVSGPSETMKIIQDLLG